MLSEIVDERETEEERDYICLYVCIVLYNVNTRNTLNTWIPNDTMNNAYQTITIIIIIIIIIIIDIIFLALFMVLSKMEKKITI